MIKTFKSVITSLLLISTTAVFGQGLSEQDRAVVDKQRNILSNPGFEASKVNWTSSGGTFSIVTSGSNLLIGKGSATFDASATSQYIESAAATIPNGLYAQSCLAKIKYLGADSNLTFQVTDGTNVIASQALSATTSSLDAELYFTCPSSGSLKLKVLSGADAAIASFDEGYIGQNYRIGTLSQTEYLGSLKYSFAANCIWTNNSSSYANYSADTDCGTPVVTNQVTAPGTKIPAAVLANVSPGTYKFTISSTFAAASNANCRWRVSDGTNASDDFSTQYTNTGDYTRAGQLTASITYTSPQTNVTFNVQAKRQSGGGSCDIEADVTDGDFVIKIEKVPPASQIVYSPNMQRGMGYVEWNSNWTSAITNTSGSWTTFNATSGDSNRTNGGVCITSGTANDVSCKIAKLPAGKYLVQVNGGVFDAHDSSSCAFGIYDGTNRKGISGALASTSSVGTFTIGTGVGAIFDYTAEQTNIEFKVQSAVISGSAGCRLRPGDFSGSSTGKGITISVIPIEQNIPMPVIVNSVQSSYSGQIKLVEGRVGGSTDDAGASTSPCTSSPCSVYRQTGDISSVTRSGAGDYTVNFTAGTFSSSPNCVVTKSDVFASNAMIKLGAFSTTSLNISSRDTSGSTVDMAFNIICMGYK